ncbi:hypothetical protein KUTeg_009420 [Tegillarca granosa]|uniref:Uncharacterized protein n=1 Tax=Tegillarca granosa TaxID=220873 RepID=A0ABQ9F6Z3_TEGGR|nr:hypothetical protein KUTeg_009420 [Tegillarca granosa]
MDHVRNITSGFKSLLVPYFLVNVFLSISYFIFKTVPPVCSILFYDCNLELKEVGMDNISCLCYCFEKQKTRPPLKTT